MISTQKLKYPTCFASALVAAVGLTAGGPRPADAGVPSDAAFQRILEELASWNAAAALDPPSPAAGEPAAMPATALPAQPDPSAPAERPEADQHVAAAAATAAEVEELQRTIAERDALVADLRQRAGKVETASRIMAAMDREPVAGGADGDAAAGQFEVGQEEIDRALERALVQTGALLLPVGMIEVDSGFAYTRREDEAPLLVMNGEQPLVAVNELRRNEIEAAMALRLGLPFDSQLEVEVPQRYEQVSNVARVGVAGAVETDRSGTGLGDVSVGFAKGLLRERGWRPDLIGRVRWDSDTGQTDDGVPLGSGFHEFTGSLTAVKRQDPLVFVGTASYTTTLEDDGVAPGDEIGLSLGTVLAASPETSLRFFLAQSFADELEVDGQEFPGSDQVSTSLILGASSVLAPQILLDFTAGIGLTEDAPDYSIHVSVPIRFSLPAPF